MSDSAVLPRSASRKAGRLGCRSIGVNIDQRGSRERSDITVQVGEVLPRSTLCEPGRLHCGVDVRICKNGCRKRSDNTMSDQGEVLPRSAPCGRRTLRRRSRHLDKVDQPHRRMVGAGKRVDARRQTQGCGTQVAAGARPPHPAVRWPHPSVDSERTDAEPSPEPSAISPRRTTLSSLCAE